MFQICFLRKSIGSEVSTDIQKFDQVDLSTCTKGGFKSEDTEGFTYPK
jgi:hypothetical protein